MTPHRWLLADRIRHAQELQETTSTAEEAFASVSGFEALVTFRTRFQQMVGVSPISYVLRSRQRETLG